MAQQVSSAGAKSWCKFLGNRAELGDEVIEACNAPAKARLDRSPIGEMKEEKRTIEGLGHWLHRLSTRADLGKIRRALQFVPKANCTQQPAFSADGGCEGSKCEVAKLSRETVFVIEDEPDILEVIEYNLKREGYQVESSRNGMEGYRRVQ